MSVVAQRSLVLDDDRVDDLELAAGPASAPRSLEPVLIRWDGLPKSFNAGHGSWPAFEAEKQLWQARFRALLIGVPETVMDVLKPGCKHKTMPVLVQRWGELERCERVLVEGRLTFPTLGRRDQGNFRVAIEKGIGDALVDLEILEDDSWYPTCRFEFGNLQARYEKGVKRTELTLFPS